MSQAAVDTALQVLRAAVSTGGDLDAAMVEATAAAQRAAAAMPYDPFLDVGPGACTFVAAVVRGSRPPSARSATAVPTGSTSHGAVQIGDDDSLAGRAGGVGPLHHVAGHGRAGAHALTKWLGVDSTDAAPTRDQRRAAGARPRRAGVRRAVELRPRPPRRPGHADRPGRGRGHRSTWPAVSQASPTPPGEPTTSPSPWAPTTWRPTGPSGPDGQVAMTRRSRWRSSRTSTSPPRPRRWTPSSPSPSEGLAPVGPGEAAEVLIIDTSGSMDSPPGRIRGRPPGGGRGHRPHPRRRPVRGSWPATDDATTVFPAWGPGLVGGRPRDTGRGPRGRPPPARPAAARPCRRGCMAARDLFATSPTALPPRHPPHRRREQRDARVPCEAVLQQCRGLFQVDCRGIGTDWVVDELRTIASTLLGHGRHHPGARAGSRPSSGVDGGIDGSGRRQADAAGVVPRGARR